MNEYTELPHKRTRNILQFMGGANEPFPSGSYKILIPKGTDTWSAVATIDRTDDDSEAWVSLDAPPTRAGAVPLGPDGDSRKVLQDLWAGKTMYFYGVPGGQQLGISQPERGGPWRADRDRWVFIDVRFASGNARQFISRIELGAEVAPPAPPDETEARVLALVQQAGLVPSLTAFGACTSDADLVGRAVSSGVWTGLIKLVRLARAGGA